MKYYSDLGDLIHGLLIQVNVISSDLKTVNYVNIQTMTQLIPAGGFIPLIDASSDSAVHISHLHG